MSSVLRDLPVGAWKPHAVHAFPGICLAFLEGSMGAQKEALLFSAC